MVRRIVVDASVVIKWFIPEDYHEEAAKLRNDHLYGHVEVYVPSHALLEVANALRKYVARKILTPDLALRILRTLLKMDLKYIAIDGPTALEALEYALRNHVSVYDAYYIVVAHKLEATMFTADEKLLSALSQREPLVKHIKYYPEESNE